MKKLLFILTIVFSLSSFGKSSENLENTKIDALGTCVYSIFTITDSGITRTDYAVYAYDQEHCNVIYQSHLVQLQLAP